MVSNVGKIFICFLMSVLFCTHMLAITMSLRVVDQNNIPIKSAMVGSFYKLEITVNDYAQALPLITVPGDEKFVRFGREIETRSINGSCSAIHRYTVRIDKPGTYELGPVQLNLDGQHLSSNAVTLLVTDGMPRHTTQKPATGMDSQGADCFARLEVHKKKVMVGEKVNATLRFYCYGCQASLHAITKPDVEYCTTMPYVGPLSGEEIIKGKKYSYLEWTFDFYPMHGGPLTIPAYLLEYDIMHANQRSRHSLFSSFFGNSFERKKLYSNAITIKVDDVPASPDGRKHSVGIFKKFDASIKPNVIKEGDAAVYTLTIHGDTNFDALEIDQLESMPSALKWYASKTSIDTSKNGSGMSAKKFEFVVQGMQAGDWHIPAQKYTYFDINTRKYATMATQPISIKVLPQSAKKAAASSHNSRTLHQRSENAHASMYESDELAPIDTQGPWYPADDRGMHKGLFVILFLMPVILFGRARMKATFERLSRSYAPSIARAKAYAHARKALSEARAASDSSRVYPIFIQFFAQRTGLRVSEITREAIEHTLKNASLSSHELTLWNDYFERIIHAAYMSPNREQQSVDLFEQGFTWLAVFEKKV